MFNWFKKKEIVEKWHVKCKLKSGDILVSACKDEKEADQLIEEAKASCLLDFISQKNALIATSEVVCIYKQSIKKEK